MTQIGVLAIQGAVKEHMVCVQKLGANSVEAKKTFTVDMCRKIV